MTVKVTFSSSVNRWVTVTRILLPKCSSKYVGFALSMAVPFLMMNEWNRDSNGIGAASRFFVVSLCFGIAEHFAWAFWPGHFFEVEHHV